MILLPVAAPVFLSAAFLVLRGVFLMAILIFPRGWLAGVCRVFWQYSYPAAVGEFRKAETPA
jgi:hypothetical protein